MLFSILPLLIVASSFVTAKPVPVWPATGHEIVSIRVAHTVADSPSRPQIAHGGRPCGKAKVTGAIRQKAIELSNVFREALGMPLAGHDDSVKVLVFHPGVSGELSARPSHGALHHQAGRPTHPFLTRLDHALMSLGFWEGLCVAFVFGCGLGALVRVAFVLAVILLRSLSGTSNGEEDDEDTDILSDAEANLLRSPPRYTAIDCKISVQ